MFDSFTAQPEALGLHENAALTRESRASEALLAGSLATQPSVEAVSGLEAGDTVQAELERLISKLPETLPTDKLEENYAGR